MPRSGRSPPPKEPDTWSGTSTSSASSYGSWSPTAQRVGDVDRTEHLGSVERVHRPGRQRSERHAESGQHPGGPQQGQCQRPCPWPGRRRHRRCRRARTRGGPRGPRSAHRRGTNRREGNVGSPNSSDRPSAVSPRSTTVKAHSARDVAAGSGSGRWTRRRWSRDGLVNRVRTRTQRLVGAQLERGGDRHLPCPGAGVGRSVDVLRPRVGGHDVGGRPDRSVLAGGDARPTSGASTTVSLVGGE